MNAGCVMVKTLVTDRHLQTGDSATEDAAEVAGGESHHH
jgi:hypothetical protein